QPSHLRLRSGDRGALAVLLGVNARIRARRVDERHDREAVPLGELHRVPRLAVALRVRHTEPPSRALVDVAALLLADEDDRAAAELAETRDHRAVIGERAVA